MGTGANSSLTPRCVVDPRIARPIVALGFDRAGRSGRDDRREVDHPPADPTGIPLGRIKSSWGMWPASGTVAEATPPGTADRVMLWCTGRRSTHTHVPRRAAQDWWVLTIGLFIVDGSHFARRGARLAVLFVVPRPGRIQAVLLHTQCVQGVRRRGAATSFSAGSNGRPSPQGRPSRRR